MSDNAKNPVPFIISDVDGTFIRWQLFHRLVEEMVAQDLLPRIVTTRMQEALEKYKDREAPFEEFVNIAVAAYSANGRLRSIRLDDLMQVARAIVRKEGKRVHVFTRELLTIGKQHGFGTAFISGSPVQVVKELARFYGVDACLGTEHPHEDGHFTGDEPRVWASNKSAAIQELETVHSIDLSRSIAIGDSESDIPMLEMVEYPIVFNPNLGLYREAQKRCWPIVVEKKLVYLETFYFTDGERVRRHAELTDLLPETLAGPLKARLEEFEILAA